MRELRDNLAAFAAMAVFAAAFLVVYAASSSLWDAAIVSILLGAGVLVILRTLFPANPELRAYNLDARRRVKRVLASVDRLTKLAGQIKDPQAQSSLLEGCRIIPQLLDQTRRQETTSFRVASTAANVQNYLTSVESVAEVYLRIQKDPSFFANADAQLAAGKEGFADFQAFALKSIQQLNAGDTQGYAANLETLRPLEVPELSQLAPAGVKS
jgi:hypothetical protein